MNHFRLSAESIGAEVVHSLLKDENCGAIVTFTGMVRQQSKGRAVVALEFEAYEPMVMKELQKIADEIHLKWKVNHILLYHRIGVCVVSEVPVIAAIASAHRAEAFEACTYLMNRLKESVPIWKREIFADGEEWVSATP